MKELQERDNEWKSVPQAPDPKKILAMFLSDGTIKHNSSLHRMIVELMLFRDYFPAIAEALIIAVDALEKIANAEWSACHECEGRCELVSIAEKARSRIRSLPL